MALSPEITAQFNALQERPIDPELQKAREVVGGLKTEDKVADVALTTAVSIAANLFRLQHPKASHAELLRMAIKAAPAAQEPLKKHYDTVRKGIPPNYPSNGRRDIAKQNVIPDSLSFTDYKNTPRRPFVPRSPENDLHAENGKDITNTVYRIFDSVIPPAAPLEIKQPRPVSAIPRLVFQA